MKSKVKTREELGGDVCNYCTLDDNERAVRNYGNGPIFCHESSLCDDAYQAYLDECEEEGDDEDDR